MMTHYRPYLIYAVIIIALLILFQGESLREVDWLEMIRVR